MCILKRMIPLWADWMAVLEIMQHPAAVLKQPAQPVEQFDESLQAFIIDLQDTLAAAPGCVGIAAPQVGSGRQIIIVDVSNSRQKKHHGRLVMINPEITAWQGSVTGREGCLSVPDYTGNVLRAETVDVVACDAAGRQMSFSFTGFEARVVQHEIDHLHGLLFLDRLVSRRRDLFRREAV